MLTKESAVIPTPSPGREVELKTLLVAYDFSVFAEAALQYAITLAEEHESEIVVAYVESPLELEAEMEGGLGAVRAARKQVQHDLQAIADSLRERGVPASAICRVGVATDVLVQLAAGFHVDLMLLGAYGHRHTDLPRLGSTAEFLLRCLPCPTMTFGPHSTPGLGNGGPPRYIVYASSLPDRLGRASRFAETFARKWGATLDIVHVIDDGAAYYNSRRNAEMDVKGAALAQTLRDMGIEARWHLWVGSPADRIVERARDLGAGMIIFGVEHHTADPAIIGVVNSTIQRATCPVLTVPGPA